jgi:hypothetical protein
MKNKHAVALGKIKTEKKAIASRENGKKGGSATSDHQKGFAIDFTCPDFGTPLECVKKISASDIQFDQLIQEGTWIHISFAPAMRRQILEAHFSKGQKTTYTLGM